MKLSAGLLVVIAVVLGSVSVAGACDQKLADVYAAKIKTAIGTQDNASLEKYSVLQAAVYHACAQENSGHMKTRYMLGEAASWDQAAQALNNESAGNLEKKRQYAHNAIKIATPIASAANSSEKEKTAAKTILWTLSWAHSG